MTEQAPEILSVRWAGHARELAEVRRRVFIEEQKVPEELEWDGEDEQARHWLASIGEQPVGTVRLLADGHIGRMAVLREHRQRGIGVALLRARSSSIAAT